MGLVFTKDKLKQFGFSSSLEWLETNGLGGYASSTVSGAHTRRYHGLLVASKRPPVERFVVLSRLDETIVVGGQRYELGTNQYPGAVHPQGFTLLQTFKRELFPEFIYQAGDVQISKTIAAVQGENTTLIIYEVLSAKMPFTMELLPLCSARDFHQTTHANEAIFKDYIFEGDVFQTKNYENSPELFISVPGSTFKPTKTWYSNFEFLEELRRGVEFTEDLFNHGIFSVMLKKGDKLAVAISTENPSKIDAHKLFGDEKKRRQALIKDPNENEGIQRLRLAADQFIVNRGQHLKSVIAGYHWFSDWGRDTMIAMQGLTMTTGREADAKKILEVFSESVSEGMLPNRFSDYGEAPEYNTVDATLWFFVAVYQYYRLNPDKKFIGKLLPSLQSIIDWHYKGTRYHIKVDADELLFAGEPGVQLTWMDAKVGDWVVTPRTGKQVEINALWYNALCIMSFLNKEVGAESVANAFQEKAALVLGSFSSVFWNKTKGCLFDFVNGTASNDDVRPNQIYAISLPFKLLNPTQGAKIFGVVTRDLLTPKGLRSLSPDSKDYKPIYEGSPLQRDEAYHQGTVWSFLLGPYIDALMFVKGEKGRVEASRILRKALETLDEAGVGSISEIFDGAAPHRPGGCIAQAWGVAELLRVAIAYDLFPAISTAKD